MNSAVENLDNNQNNNKKLIPSFDAKNFDYTQAAITFNKPNKLEDKNEERDDDPDFDDIENSNKKVDGFGEKVMEEDDELIYLKDKRKLEVIFKNTL